MSRILMNTFDILNRFILFLEPEAFLFLNFLSCIEVWKWKSLSVSDSLDPMDYTVTSHGILQARVLEWVAFPFSRESFQPRDQTQVAD